MAMPRPKLHHLAALSLPVLAVAGYTVWSRRSPVGNPLVPEPLKPVDLNAYLGRWYEVARYEQAFEKGCEGVSAEYRLRPDGKIDVVNSCRAPDGKFRTARGTAKIVPGSQGAKLKISFYGPLYIGNYWVMDHAEDYSWSIVGDPTGRYLWLLSRQQVPEEMERHSLIKRATALGYDTSRLVITTQP
ncbi:apolipoprotein D and lipocalin family protein [Acidocella aminolytica 101 = DSM 11237]|jgi:apolipoprotein D and lipocalin family protein|uniref:Outer membrane lipoprotein Blc n=2 Tax=Acidocella TaxID=50709 RepID=A0A0D6PHQ1_9PROT|nr:lipocalin [Acidocella aminolytica 101 = DSM 11237]GBQ37605.1 bacterial lipocalin [Acidocella aminolytica 101 = DSM 11237]SHE52917.1 apolipoprotein D and lipocalin family protein [Acidocella aminolytica 101 = DSM 11237]